MPSLYLLTHLPRLGVTLKSAVRGAEKMPSATAFTGSVELREGHSPRAAR